MKTLHYVAHIALLTLFTISAVFAGFYLTGSDHGKAAILSIFKKDALNHKHTPSGMTSSNSHACEICLELGIAGCSATAPIHLRHLTARNAQQKLNKPEDQKGSGLKDAVVVWVRSFVPERVVKDTKDHMERDVLMTYAAWE